MILFQDVQSTLAALITARFVALSEVEGSESLEDIAAIDHRGTQDNEDACEAALRAKGVAIAVCVPVEGDAASQGAGKVVMDVKVPVFLEINSERNNPEKNEDGANLDIYVAFKEIVAAAVNATRPTNEHDRWVFSGFKLDTADAGLFRLALFFSKRCVL